MPMSCTACAATTAVWSTLGAAMPMSSLARTMRRRAMKRGSSPASIMRASQCRAASGSEPRTDLMKALMTS